MQITDVRIVKSIQEGRVRATASITIDNEFAVHGIKLIDSGASDNGFFISFPSRRLADGSYKDIAHPINSETRIKIQDAIVKAYNELD